MFTPEEYEALCNLLCWSRAEIDRFSSEATTPKDREEARTCLYEWRYAKRGVVKLGRAVSATKMKKIS